MKRALLTMIAAALLLTACSSGGGGTPTARGVAAMLSKRIPQMTVTAVYTEKSDPNHLMGRPGGYTSKISFADSRVSKADVVGEDEDATERGGSIEVYSDPQQAKARAAYIATLLEGAPLLGSEYHYLHGGVLLRVDGNLTPAVARKYEAALASSF